MLEPADDDPGRPPVVVIGHRLWADRFGRSPSALGATLTLDGVPATVVGVLPETFALPNLSTELLAPLRPAADGRCNERGSNFLRVIAHLAPGAHRRARRARRWRTSLPTSPLATPRRTPR